MSKRLVLVFLMILCLSSFAQAASPEYGGTFTEGITADFGEMFNPILNETSYDSEVNNLIFDGLISFNDKMLVIPNVARSWEYSKDGLTITFYLRNDVKFHDGHLLTAEDVLYTFSTILHKDYTGVRSGDYIGIKGAEAYKNGETNKLEGIKIINDFTISFTLAEPDAPFLSNMSMGILPAHLLKNIPVKELENAEFNRKPIGTGPFKYKEYVSQQYFIAEANKDYFKGRPYLDRYIVRRVSTESLPIHYEKRELDWSYMGVKKEHFDKVKSYKHLNSHTYLSLSYSYIGINHLRISDKKVRQAMAYGFNRDVIVKSLLKGFGYVANSPIPPVSWAYSDSVSKYAYNQAQAIKLLEEAGYTNRDKNGVRENKDGKKLEFSLYVSDSSDTGIKICEMFQQMMKIIGVKINVVLMEFNALCDMTVSSEDWDMYTMSWSLSTDPDNITIFHSTAPWNDVRFFNDKNDELLEKGRVEMDQKKRIAIYSEWQKLVSEELPYIFLYYPLETEVIDKRIQGYNQKPGPLGLFVGPDGSLLHKIWIPKAEQNK